MSTPSFSLLFEQLNQTIKGQNRTLRHLVATLFAQGHILLEDLPGTGKTTMAKTLAQCFAAHFARIQFTPDLMPSDITGTTVFNPKEQAFDFHPGAIFCNILLADEINRASPRTQSALLEAMEEAQVSTEGKSLKLPHPFFVIATENPVEMHGTYPLPEAQLDRFMVKLSLGYVNEDQEVSILKSKLPSSNSTNSPLQAITPSFTLEQLHDFQQQVLHLHLSDASTRYIVQLTRHTRTHPNVLVGASPRGAISLMRLSQALAFLDHQTVVLPKHIQEAAPLVLAHRLVLRDSAKMNNVSSLHIVEDALNAVSAPV